MKEKQYHTYIMTNPNNTALYTGVTSNLLKRIYEHKNGSFKNSFTSKYRISKLVYLEETNNIEAAIQREKQIKAGSRNKKIGLIEANNPEWKDLSSNW